MIARGHRLVLAAAVSASLVLALLPLPPLVAPLRPLWMALVLAYWVLEHGDEAGLGLSFACGLLLDLVLGTTLGEHALRLVIMAYLLDRFRSRLRFFPVWQQTLAMAALLANDWVVGALIHAATHQPQAAFASLLAVLTGALLWGPVHAVLAAAGRRRR